jgi:2-keto-4-pentenoate hydratase/2-oxohepta-3-ene-1,7-dioic acid hydratase in catechol pathway
MRWMTFEYQGQQSYGLEMVERGQVVDLRASSENLTGEPLPMTLLGAIENSDRLVKVSEEIISRLEEGDTGELVILSLNEVQRLAPIPKPPKNVLCVGKNYADHAIEMGGQEAIPDAPIVFTKAPATVIGTDQPVQGHFHVTQELDYEGELAVIIGKKGKSIPIDEAMDYIFGYTIINDVTARDIQRKHKQFFLGKSMDTFCPMGPSIVHHSVVKDPHHLSIQTRVNDELRQNGNTEQLIFNLPTLISVLSAGMTLEPGDIIATGTPSGVGSGFKPPRFLHAGDVVEITVEGIGTLKNPIVS